MITYKVIPRKNPSQDNDEVKYYASAVNSGAIGIKEVAVAIERTSTVSSADIKAVLDALQQELIRAMQAGQSVRLGDVGSFCPTLNGSGCPNEADFNASLIKRVKVRYTPSTALLAALIPGRTVQLRKATTDKADTAGGGADTL